MFRQVLAVGGIIVFSIALFILQEVLLGDLRAVLLDAFMRGGQGRGPFGECFGGCCSFVAALSKRTMSDSESQALTITFNDDRDVACGGVVKLNAPNFDIGPVEAKQYFGLDAGARDYKIVWILTPRRLGTFQLSVDTGPQTQILGVTVTNTLGLDTWQAQLVSTIGSFLGPLFTLPWLYEKWRERKSGRTPHKPPSKKRNR